MKISEKHVMRVCGTGAASILALGIYSMGQALSQSSNLPPVTVDAPTPRAVSRPALPKRAATARGPVRRAASPPFQRAEPVRFVAPSTSVMGTPPAVFAGGQVATGQTFGLLGTRANMDTPFSSTSYTLQTIDNLQAKTLRDVLETDPSIRLTAGYGTYFDSFTIRGFAYGVADVSFNGLYGLTPVYAVPIENVERIEVFKGASALLGGITPGGSVGGAINIVPKRATDTPINRITFGYLSDGNFGTHVDIGRRFGELNEWGVRVNGAFRDGEGPVDRNRTQVGFGSVALDYRGERFRASFDVAHQLNDVRSPQFNLTLPPGLLVPRPIDMSSNYVQSFARDKQETTYGVFRSEFDLTRDVTIFGAIGKRNLNRQFANESATLQNNAGNISQSYSYGPFSYDTVSSEIGARGRFNTGPVLHEWSVVRSEFDDDISNISRVGPTFLSNIYNPVLFPDPGLNAGGDPVLISRRGYVSYGGTNVMSILDKRVQFIVGARNQDIQQRSFGPSGLQTSLYDSSVTTPAFGVVVKPLAWLSLYANYIEGLSAGVVVGAGRSNVGAILPPVQTQQKEAGAKFDFKTIGANFALFEISQPSYGTNVVTNATELIGETINRGIEFSMFGEPVAGVRIIGGVLYMDPRLSRTPNGLNTGRLTPGISHIQANAGVEWDLPFARGLTATANLIHTGAAFYDAANLQRVSDWTRLDLGARYTFAGSNRKPVTINARIINVTGLDLGSGDDGWSLEGTATDVPSFDHIRLLTERSSGVCHPKNPAPNQPLDPPS